MNEPGVSENALCLLFSRITAALYTAIDRDLAEFGVTSHQWPVLVLTYEERANRPSELARLIGIDRGAVTRLVDRLVDKGLVERIDDPGDLRAARVELTERGRTLVPVLANIVAARYDATLAHLDPAERDPITSMLSRLDQSLLTNGAEHKKR